MGAFRGLQRRELRSAVGEFEWFRRCDHVHRPGNGPESAEHSADSDFRIRRDTIGNGSDHDFARLARNRPAHGECFSRERVSLRGKIAQFYGYGSKRFSEPRRALEPVRRRLQRRELRNVVEHFERFGGVDYLCGSKTCSESAECDPDSDVG